MTTAQPYLALPSPQVEITVTDDDLRRMARQASTAVVLRTGLVLIVVLVAICATGTGPLRCRASIRVAFLEPLIRIFFAIIVPLATVFLVVLWFAVKSSSAQSILILLTGGAPGPFYRHTCVCGPDTSTWGSTTDM